MNLADTFFNTSVLADSIGSLLAGFRLTALLGATSLVLATALGLLLVVLRLYAVRPLRWAAIALIDVLRAIPLLVLLVIVYYALPFVGLRLPPFWAATAALSLVASASSPRPSAPASRPFPPARSRPPARWACPGPG